MNIHHYTYMLKKVNTQQIAGQLPQNSKFKIIQKPYRFSDHSCLGHERLKI